MRKFIGDFDLNKDKIRIRNERIVHHLKDVLRMKEGDKFVACDGRGREAEADILEVGKDYVFARLAEAKSNKKIGLDITLFVSILKNNNLELVVRKCTEIGVMKFVPVIFDRTVKKGIKRSRLERIIISAAEQSKRSFLPQLGDKADFKEVLNTGQSVSNILVPHLKANSNISDIEVDGLENIGVFIGPEGGFSNGEVEEFRNIGADIVSLGSLTLRSETSAIVSAFNLINRSNL